MPMTVHGDGAGEGQQINPCRPFSLHAGLFAVEGCALRLSISALSAAFISALAA
jgi:hypothetical protein